MRCHVAHAAPGWFLPQSRHPATRIQERLGHRLASAGHRFLLGHRALPYDRRYCSCAWERAMNDVATEVRDILVFHLGADERRLTDDARLSEDLGADSLDVVEIVMSCEERFAIAIPNRVATRLATVGDAVRFIEAEMAVR